MNDNITVYEKPTCTKCREMDRFLRESSVDFSKINYYIEPLSEKKLRELIKKMGIKPRELLRTSEPVYRELGLGKKELSDSEITEKQFCQNNQTPSLSAKAAGISPASGWASALSAASGIRWSKNAS